MGDSAIIRFHMFVSYFLQEVKKWFPENSTVRPTLIVRDPSNPDMDVFIGNDHDFDELIHMIERCRDRAKLTPQDSGRERDG